MRTRARASRPGGPARPSGAPLRRFGFLASLCLLLALFLSAKDGRDFAGFYELGEPTDLGEEVRVALTVRVFNYSDADVIGATITLEDMLPGEDLGAYLSAVNIRDRESVRLSDSFTVPRRLYDSWQEGSTPRLRIDFKDAAGNPIRRMIELAPLPVGEE